MEYVPVELHDVTVASWSVGDVVNWLRLQRFSDEVCDTFQSNAIDGYALLRTTEHDLLHPPVAIKQLGTIKHLVGAVNALKCTTIARVDINPTAIDPIAIDPIAIDPKLPFSETSQNFNGSPKTNHVEKNIIHSDGQDRWNDGQDRWNDGQDRWNDGQDRWNDGTESPDSESDDEESEPKRKDAPKRESNVFVSHHRHLPRLKPEIGKAFISFLYFLLTSLLTAFVMVIVHDRVPDMEKYPPLPDFVLDNIPLIPWAFDMCEVAGFLLSLTWCTVLTFHKHRFILIRRFFALMGTIFLLRSVCMLITSLSVPGRHLKCAGKTFGDRSAKLTQALVIARGFGMSIQGVRTCGDYMFSGHTVVITVLNFFITEYTPKRYRMIHLASWVLNLFGMFFILAAHEHYSIDVFIAFYISSRLFLYYHTMANAAYGQRHPRRATLNFPLYAFFESEVNRVVPNEYEWPFMLKWPFFKFQPDVEPELKTK